MPQYLLLVPKVPKLVLKVLEFKVLNQLLFKEDKKAVDVTAIASSLTYHAENLDPDAPHMHVTVT